MQVFIVIRRQQGAVLLVTLMMVLLLTIIGISAIKSSSLQELMAGNMRDRNTGFQAAEYSLRVGELRLAEATLPAFDCSDAMCEEKVGKDAVLFWAASDWATLGKPVSDTLAQVYAKPRYVVESLPIEHGENAAMEGSGIDVVSLSVTGDADPYRVTARGVGVTNNTEIILQTTYLRKF